MKVIINNDDTHNKPLEIDENFFTGKHKIIYNGKELERKDKNTFLLKDSQGTEEFSVRGHQIWGTSISLFGRNIQVFHKVTWYEIALPALIFASCLMCGWVGLIVGLMVGLLGYLAVRVTNSIIYKIVVALLLLAIAWLLSYILAGHVFKVYLFFM